MVLCQRAPINAGLTFTSVASMFSTPMQDGTPPACSLSLSLSLDLSLSLSNFAFHCYIGVPSCTGAALELFRQGLLDMEALVPPRTVARLGVNASAAGAPFDYARLPGGVCRDQPRRICFPGGLQMNSCFNAKDITAQQFAVSGVCRSLKLGEWSCSVM